MKKYTSLCLFVLSISLIVSVTAYPAIAQDITTNPDRVRLEVDDLHRFAEVMKIIESGEISDTVSIIENNYIAKASPGLKAYTERFNVTAATIASSIDSRPSLYADIDNLIHTILEQKDELRSGFWQLQVLFPRAAFPPVWFFVGGHGPRGQAAMEGALIGSEGLSNQPERLAPLVLHELAHFQSAMVQGVEPTNVFMARFKHCSPWHYGKVQQN